MAICRVFLFLGDIGWGNPGTLRKPGFPAGYAWNGPEMVKKAGMTDFMQKGRGKVYIMHV